jgi:hypothetical protein
MTRSYPEPLRVTGPLLSLVLRTEHVWQRYNSSIDMYNNDVGKKSAQKIMKQTGDLKAATFYFAS